MGHYRSIAKRVRKRSQTFSFVHTDARLWNHEHSTITLVEISRLRPSVVRSRDLAIKRQRLEDVALSLIARLSV